MSAPHPDGCPHCGEAFGQNFRLDFTASRVIGLCKGNPTTVGQQAEINARRVGKEQLQLMAEEGATRKRKFTGPIPKGAKLADPLPVMEGRPWFRDGFAGLPTLDKPLDLSKVPDTDRYIMQGK